MFLSSSRIVSRNKDIKRFMGSPSAIKMDALHGLLSLHSDNERVVKQLKKFELYSSLPDRFVEYYSNYADINYELVNLGLANSTRRYIIEISFHDLLPLIFHRICGSDLHALDDIANFEELSRILLDLDFDNMDFSLHTFVGKDANLDRFLYSLPATSELDLLSTFMLKVHSIMRELKEGVCTQLLDRNTSLADYEKLSILSIGYSSIIFTSNSPFTEMLEVDDTFVLHPRCVSRGEAADPNFVYGGIL